MQRKTKRRPDAFAAERRRAAPYTRPDKISASMFPLVRATHGNGLRSRERVRYVPDEVDSQGNPRSVRDTCFAPLTSQAPIRAVAETAL